MASKFTLAKRPVCAIETIAVHGKLSLLLTDEPAGNLDSKNSKGIMGLSQGLDGNGMTVVMVTHSHECAETAERILQVSDGCLVN